MSATLPDIKITKDLLPALQGVVPAVIATCAKDGTANVTYISQVFYVDDNHVALSWQFMNKTWKNLQENPVASVVVTCPSSFSMWKLGLRYVEQQTEGPLFEEMDMQLQAFVSSNQVKVDFLIKAAVICKVESIEQIHNSQH